LAAPSTSFHLVAPSTWRSYLKLSRLEVGLLINFHGPRLKDGIRRLVNHYQGS